MTGESRKSSFQTKTVLRALLASAGAFPRKRYGQCFLIDRNLMSRLIAAAELERSDCVLEVGCGTGSLTGLLAAEAGYVVAVEVDARLAEIAAEQLGAPSPPGVGDGSTPKPGAPPLPAASSANVQLLRLDALKNKSTVAPEIVAALEQRQRRAGGTLKLVANLPYDIATSLVMNLLLGELSFRRLCFTVQSEVAERFLAKPHTSDYGPVSIVCQSLTTGRRVARLPPTAFWPSPKVDSAMLRLDARPRNAVEIADLSEFAHFVRTFFQYRRKTLLRTAGTLNLREKLTEAMAKIGVAANARPENVTVEQWVSLYQTAC